MLRNTAGLRNILSEFLVLIHIRRWIATLQRPTIDQPLAPYGFVWKCCVPLNPMVLLIIIPTIHGYFIGGLDSIFRSIPILAHAFTDFHSATTPNLQVHAVVCDHVGLLVLTAHEVTLSAVSSTRRSRKSSGFKGLRRRSRNHFDYYDYWSWRAKHAMNFSHFSSFFNLGFIAERIWSCRPTKTTTVRVVNEANSVVPALGNGPLHLPVRLAGEWYGMIWIHENSKPCDPQSNSIFIIYIYIHRLYKVTTNSLAFGCLIQLPAALKSALSRSTPSTESSCTVGAAGCLGGMNLESVESEPWLDKQNRLLCHVEKMAKVAIESY